MRLVHWRIGADGTPHERGAADIAMKTPVQADFSAAGAILGPGLTQDRTWRLFPGSERIQDVRKLAWVEDDETDYGGRSVDEEIDWRRDHARLMAEPEVRKVKERYARARTEERAVAAVAAGEYADIKTAVAASARRYEKGAGTQPRDGRPDGLAQAPHRQGHRHLPRCHSGPETLAHDPVRRADGTDLPRRRPHLDDPGQ